TFARTPRASAPTAVTAPGRASSRPRRAGPSGILATASCRASSAARGRPRARVSRGGSIQSSASGGDRDRRKAGGSCYVSQLRRRFPGGLAVPEIYPVHPHVRDHAHIRSRDEYDALHRRSLEDPGAFWGEQARVLEWFHPWHTVFDADYDAVDF